MPLDFTNPITKPAALAAYTAACETPDLADWQAIAAMLAQHLQPKARRTKTEAADTGEWCEYTEAQRKGRGGSFLASRRADFLFADGVVITVSIAHRINLDKPDWAKAARCAVSFYKAKRWAKEPKKTNWTHYDLTEERAIELGIMWEDRSYALPVPEIVEAVDVTRNVLADLARCNAATIRERNAA